MRNDVGYQCQGCGRVFDSSTEWREHRDTAHAPPKMERVVVCDCGCGATLPDNGRDEAGKPLPRRRTS